MSVVSFLTPSQVDESKTIFLDNPSSLLSWRLLINVWSTLDKHSKLLSLKRLLEEACAALNSMINEHELDVTSSLLRQLNSQSSLQWLDIATLDPDCAKAVLKFASEHVGSDTNDLCSLLFHHLLGSIKNNTQGMKSDSSSLKKTTTTTKTKTMKVTTRPTLAPGIRQVFDVLTRLCHGSRNCFLYILERVEEISNFVKDVVCGGLGGKMCSKKTIASAMALLSTLYRYTQHPRHLRRSKVVSTEKKIRVEEEEMGGRRKHMHNNEGLEHEHESNNHNQNDDHKVHDDNDGDHHHHRGHNNKEEDASLLHYSNSNAEEKKEKEEEEYGDDAEYVEDDELSNKEEEEEKSPVIDDVGVDDELLKAAEEEEEEKVTPHSPAYQTKPSVACLSSPPSPFSPSSPSSSLITLKREAEFTASPSPQLTTHDDEKVASLYHNEHTSMKSGSLFPDHLNSHNDSQSSLSSDHQHQDGASTFSVTLANEVSLLWRLAVPLMSERELQRTIDEVSEYWKTATTHLHGSLLDVDDVDVYPVADKNEVQTMKEEEEEEIQGPDRKEVVVEEEEEEEEELVSPDLSYLGGTAGDYGQSYGGDEEEEEEYVEDGS